MAEQKDYEALKLGNQLCFPLYACAKEIVRRYKPFLDKIDLTYTQYIVMMVLWEQKELNVKTLGEYLYLDSGTLTPVIKRLETKGLITKLRDKSDGRGIIIAITPKGEALREQAVDIPKEMGSCVKLTPEDAATLYRILHQLLGSISEA